jgi:hypothetical protein
LCIRNRMVTEWVRIDAPMPRPSHRHTRMLTEHAGLLGVDITDGGLLVAVVRTTETIDRPMAMEAGSAAARTIVDRDGRLTSRRT